ncbi:unnamed protein product [Parnassius mnemosyne]|uniref:ABC transporter domain-containing protein n=1 Tax=Parnassius mnemosyne TaxID=213953 RepID=A0AAV1KPD2_9NEOP
MDNRSEEFKLPVLQKFSLDSQTSAPRILYTPDTELTRMLMDQVGEALYLPRFDAVPKKYERSYLLSNESQSGEALNALQSVDAVIVFENITIEQFRRFYGHSFENNRAFADAVFFALDFILFLGPLLSFVLTMIRLTEEKSTGIQELIKMMGVTPLMLGVTHFLNSLPPCLLFSIGGTMLIYVNQEIPLETHPLIIFLGLLLHFITMIAMAFACSYITKTKHGVNFENWSTQFHKFTDGSRNGSIRMSYMMQLIQIAYFFTLAWYLKKKEFWMKYPSIPEGISNKSNYDAAYSKYFEDPPDNLEVAVNVVNVRKIFNSRSSSFVALDNVSLKFYKGEITVLVGHNGAGKTTLISIIAGMIMQSSGKVYVEGLDTVIHQAQLRKKIALCPQHNLFFPNLTVQEHLMFFSLLKGGTNKEAMKSSEELLKQLDLTEKASWSMSKLSGGLLRRLQIGCTLCSDASILLLDEPTSGLDIDARRELWDILLVGSGFRVSITTAHEPDVDKITKSMRKGSPDAILKDKNLRTLVFDLPPGADMTSLFNSLEYHKIALGIESLGVGAVSLEEAFME